MDLRKIAGDLVSKVEGLVQQQGEKTGEAGKIDTAKEKSIFQEELNKLNVTEAEAKEIWGLALSGNIADVKSPAKAQTRGGEGSTIIINVSNEINWYININIDVNLSKELETLINNLVQDLNNNQNANFEALMEFLKTEGTQNTNVILAAIKGLFDAFEADNDKDHAELMEVLNKLVAQLEAANVKIENLEGMVADLVKGSFEVLEMMGVELDAIKKAIENSNKKQEEQIEILALINETILQLTNKFDSHSQTQVEQLNQLLNMVGQNGVTLDQVLTLLKAIKADTSEGCSIGKEILALIEKNGIETTTQLTNIYNAIIEKGENDPEIQKQILEILKSIKEDTGKISETNLKILDIISTLDASIIEQATKIYNAILSSKSGGSGIDEAVLKEFLEVLNAIKNNTEEIKETNKQILTAIGDLDATLVEEATKIYNKILISGGGEIDEGALKEFLDLLQKIADNTDEIKETNKQILEAIGKLDASMVTEMTKMYNLILQQGDNTKVELEKFYELLNNIENAIKNLDADLKAGISEVIEAINNKVINSGSGDVTVNVDLSAIEALLNQILKEVQNNTDINKEGFKAILDKLAEMGNNAGQVDLSTIENLLTEIKELTKGNGDKLNSIINNQETIVMFLENFKKGVQERLDTLINNDETFKAQLQEIIEKLNALIDKVKNNECNCDVDGAALMAKLQEIIDAIQDGSCQCKHSSDGTGNTENDDSNDESINNDLDEIFGPRKAASNSTNSINDIKMDNGLKDGKFIGPDNQMYIRKNGIVYDLSGKQVNL